MHTDQHTSRSFASSGEALESLGVPVRVTTTKQRVLTEKFYTNYQYIIDEGWVVSEYADGKWKIWYDQW